MLFSSGTTHTSETVSLPWSKSSKLFLAIFIIFTILSLKYSVHPWFDADPDPAMYIACAKSMIMGTGYTYNDNPFMMRPPGFSILISPLLSIFGTNFQILNLYISLFGIAGVVLLFIFLRPRLKWNIALLVALSVWLNPMYQKFCNQIFSDIPGLTLLLFCLIFERYSSRIPSARREIILGICIGISAYIRSIIIFLVPAIIISRILNKLINPDETSWKSFLFQRIILMAVLACLIQLPWHIRNSNYKDSSLVADQTIYLSYSSGFWNTDGGDPSSPEYSLAEILDRIPINCRQMVNAVGKSVYKADSKSTQRIINIIVTSVFACCFFIILVKRKAPAEFLILANLLLLSVYFSFKPRLILPFYVLSLAAVIEVAQDFFRKILSDRSAGIIVSIILILLVAVNFKPREKWKIIEQAHDYKMAISSKIQPVLNENTRLGFRNGAISSVYFDQTIYSLARAVQRSNSIEAVEGIIEKYNLNTVIIFSNITKKQEEYPTSEELLQYFTKQYGPPLKIMRASIFYVDPHTNSQS